MAFTRKFSGETLPEKVVVVTGPTLGTILGFIAFGAALGAAAALYFRNSQGALAEGDSLGATADGGQRIHSLVERLNKLQTRIKSLASRTRDTVSNASEVLGPVIHEAVNEARNAARDAEEELQAEIDTPLPPLEALEKEAKDAEGAGDPAI